MDLIIDGYREIKKCLENFQKGKSTFEDTKGKIEKLRDNVATAKTFFLDNQRDFVEDMNFILRDDTSIEQALERVGKRIAEMNVENLLQQKPDEEEQEKVTHVYVEYSGKYFCIPIEYYEKLDKQAKDNVDVIRLITNKKRMYGIRMAEIYVKGEKVKLIFEKDKVYISFLKPSRNDNIISGDYDTNQKRFLNLSEEDTYDGGHWFKSEKQEFVEKYLTQNRSLFANIKKHLEELSETHIYDEKIKTLRQLRSLIEIGKPYPDDEARRQAEEAYLKQEKEKAEIQRTLDKATDAVKVLEGRIEELKEQLKKGREEEERMELEKKKTEERRYHADYYSL